MRRIISLFLALVCVCGLCACSSEHTVCQIHYFVLEGEQITDSSVDIIFQPYTTSDPSVYKNAIAYSDRHKLVGMYAAKDMIDGVIPDKSYFCDEQPKDINQTEPTAPTVPTDLQITNSDVEKMKQYLNKKYNMDFTHEFTSAGVSVFSHESLKGLIHVFPYETVKSFNLPLHWWGNEYADNGYLIVCAEKAVQYYASIITQDLGDYTILPYIDIIANPSSITADCPYETYLNIVNNYAIPECIILTNKMLSDNELEQLENDFIAADRPVALRVFTMETSEQATCTPGDIMQLGLNHKDVQYYKILNTNKT